MIEPHLGLPVCIALAIWMPATRFPLAVAFGRWRRSRSALLGPATNLEYFTSVLPAHALSEVTRDTQYSLTAVLAALGLSHDAAVQAARSGTLRCSSWARRRRAAARKSAETRLFSSACRRRLRSSAERSSTSRRSPRRFRRRRCWSRLTRKSVACWRSSRCSLLAVPWVWVVSPALHRRAARPGWLSRMALYGTELRAGAARRAGGAAAGADRVWPQLAAPRLRRSRTYRCPRSIRASPRRRGAFTRRARRTASPPGCFALPTWVG